MKCKDGFCSVVIKKIGNDEASYRVSQQGSEAVWTSVGFPASGSNEIDFKRPYAYTVTMPFKLPMARPRSSPSPSTTDVDEA